MYKKIVILLLVLFLQDNLIYHMFIFLCKKVLCWRDGWVGMDEWESRFKDCLQKLKIEAKLREKSLPGPASSGEERTHHKFTLQGNQV